MMRVMNLKKELDVLPEEFIILILVDETKYLETNITLLRILLNEKQLSGIYITVNRSCNDVMDQLKENKIKIEKLFFIDVITKTPHGESKREGNCLFVSSPQNLTEISLALTQMVKSIPERNKFLFLDSISTFLIYNQIGKVSKFLHFLTLKLREWEMDGIFISLQKDADEKLILQLTQFCDKTIVLDERE